MVEAVTIGRATRRRFDNVAIYELCEWPSGEPRYVGKTVQYLIDRRKEHIRQAKRGNQKPLYRWLRKKRETSGRGFLTRLIEYVPADADWASREQYWIREYRERGHRLLNLTDGGEGLPGHQFSIAHRSKIAAALRTGEHFACQRCGARFWRKRNEIARGHNKFCSRVCSNRRAK